MVNSISLDRNKSRLADVGDWLLEVAVVELSLTTIIDDAEGRINFA